MRDRIRSKGFRGMVESGNILHPIHGWIPIEDPAPFTVPHGMSILTDRVGHAFWNPCTHFRAQYVGQPVGHCDAVGNCVAAVVYHVHKLTVLDACQICSDTLAASRDAIYDDWIAGLYREFTDQVPNYGSLANMLIELRGGVKEFLPEMADLRRSIGSNYLKIKFGIQPFLKDLKDCVDAYGRFKRRMSFLKSSWKKTYVDRRKLTIKGPILGTLSLGPYSIWGSSATPPPPPLPPEPAVRCDLETIFREESVDGAHIATAIMRNHLRGLDNIGRQVDAMAAVLGLTNPVKILWNALPWTWLADWFVDTNHILDRLEGQPFEGKLILEQAFVSTHLTTGGSVLTILPATGDQSGGEEGTVRLQVYNRSDALEIEDSLISPYLVRPSLNGSQSAILLALLDRRCTSVPNVVRFYKQMRKRLR